MPDNKTPIEFELTPPKQVEVQKQRTSEKKSTRGRKSTKEKISDNPLPNLPDDEILYSKQYYSMGETSVFLNESQAMIRHWLNDIDMINPRTNRKGDRLFKPDEIKLLYAIAKLIREKKYTLQGAIDYIKQSNRAVSNLKAVQSLENIKSFLIEMKAHL